MKLQDFIILSLMVGPCIAMTVQSINELQALLNVYKEVLVDKEAAATPQQKTKSNLPMIKSEDSLICGRKIRYIYQKCKNNTLGGKTSDCDKRYSENYPVCFFGNTILPGKANDGKTCYKTCLSYMDNCLMHSNKLEIFLCMGARDRCMQQCQPNGNHQERIVENRQREIIKEEAQVISKRVTCNRECSNNYKTCKDWVDLKQVCDAAKMVCNGNCKKAFQ